MTGNWLTMVFAIILIVCGNLLLASCLSQRNYDLIHNPCPEPENTCDDPWTNPDPIEETPTEDYYH